MKAIRRHWIFYYHSYPYWLMTGSFTKPIVELTVSKSNIIKSITPLWLQNYLPWWFLEDSNSDLQHFTCVLTHRDVFLTLIPIYMQRKSFSSSITMKDPTIYAGKKVQINFHSLPGLKSSWCIILLWGI